jgi:hypothetical protein
MTEQITLEEALKLVQFKQAPNGSWYVKNVYGDAYGNVYGNVCGYVWGNVEGTINGREWQFIETPKEKLKRLIDEGADKDQLLEAINQLEESDD